jgi:RHS repeat-associated protein
LVDVTSGVTNTYEYGNGRIAQNNSGGGTSYFLGDALGSVRQLTDSNGNITLTKSYTPYGSVLSSSGSGASAYGFTSEWTDNTGLVYLRARYYAPGVGRFITRDRWVGDYNNPLTLNGWNYVEGNPINRHDPSGLISQDQDTDASNIIKNLLNHYDVYVEKDWGEKEWYAFQSGWPFIVKKCGWEKGKWDMVELQTLEGGVIDLVNAMGNAKKFRTFIGVTVITRGNAQGNRGITSYGSHVIEFQDQGTLPTTVDKENSATIDKWTVVHEFGHAWDRIYNWRLSARLESYTGGYTNLFWSGLKSAIGNCDEEHRLPGCNQAGYYYGPLPPGGSAESFDRKEDFAESVAAYVYPDIAQSRVAKFQGEPALYYSDYTKTNRWAFIDGLIKGTITP